MSDGSMFLTVFSIILQVFSLSIGIYYLIVGITGFLPIKDKNKKISDKTHKFALIISAHNEEVVIGNMVESLKQLDKENTCKIMLNTVKNIMRKSLSVIWLNL